MYHAKRSSQHNEAHSNKRYKEMEKNSIERLSEELRLPQDELEIFLISHVPEEQLNTISRQHNTPDDYLKILKDVLHALNLTDAQNAALALKLNINVETINAFASLLKIQPEKATQIMINLHRFGVSYDISKKCMVRKQNDHTQDEYTPDKAQLYVNKGWNLARFDATRSHYQDRKKIKQR
jgi:hypothetical protein